MPPRCTASRPSTSSPSRTSRWCSCCAIESSPQGSEGDRLKKRDIGEPAWRPALRHTARVRAVLHAPEWRPIAQKTGSRILVRHTHLSSAGKPAWLQEVRCYRPCGRCDQQAARGHGYWLCGVTWACRPRVRASGRAWAAQLACGIRRPQAWRAVTMGMPWNCPSTGRSWSPETGGQLGKAQWAEQRQRRWAGGRR